MGLYENGAGNYPKVEPTAVVHSTAVLIGNVRVGARVFVGPNAVIRSDEIGSDGTVQPITIGDESNIQDCAVIHALGGTEVKIGQRVSLAHSSIIHGPCEIGSDCFVGFGSVVFKATLGPGVIVMHKALVEGVAIPGGLHVPSMTALRSEMDVGALSRVTEELTDFARDVSRANALLVESALNNKQVSKEEGCSTD